MPKKKPAPARREPFPVDAPAAADKPEAPSRFVVFRETIESVVVAFVLAFLFRTFEAEAFVIPTGSMSPSLQGRHKDVACAQCGYRFRTSASSEDPEDLGRRSQFQTFEEAEVVGGMCPMCRYPMPYTSVLPASVRDEVAAMTDLADVPTVSSYPGDRILVNKYGFDFNEPQRWDVVVFKFPGDGDMNYIKRLVGLPGEQLQIYQGDVFTRPLAQQAEYTIERKPADKVEAMLQPVHDTDYDPAVLYKMQWPLRWAATTPNGWNATATLDDGDQTVEQEFSIDGAADDPVAWLRYRHIVPDSANWIVAGAAAKPGALAEMASREGITEAEALESIDQSKSPRLISDFNSYNARIHRGMLGRDSWATAMDRYLGYNWVGDLAVDADVTVQEARGELVLDLVEAGYHFRATINLETGVARLGIVDGRTDEALAFTDEAPTPVSAPGEYKLRFANVDDRLHLWVDGAMVPFEHADYDPDALFPGGRTGMLPWASEDDAADQGDLAPAGVGATGAKLTIDRLAVLRDVYYIATNDMMPAEAMYRDYDSPINTGARELFALRTEWPRFATRRKVEFPVKEGQLFVMGDNSPKSADCRLWVSNGGPRSKPGGRYLDRRLLIGKAVCVFWPHSWGGIPGLPQLPGFPNFGDMRLVR